MPRRLRHVRTCGHGRLVDLIAVADALALPRSRAWNDGPDISALSCRVKRPRELNHTQCRTEGRLSAPCELKVCLVFGEPTASTSNAQDRTQLTSRQAHRISCVFRLVFYRMIFVRSYSVRASPSSLIRSFRFSFSFPSFIIARDGSLCESKCGVCGLSS